MSLSQSPKSIANICLFCSDVLPNPKRCRYCGFKYCSEHILSSDHNCIKTRYQKYVKKTNRDPNLTSGQFRVVCNVCGYVSEKANPIEFAGDELIQHSQIGGCKEDIFLQEMPKTGKNIEKKSLQKTKTKTPKEEFIDSHKTNNDFKNSIVNQIIKISSLKEKGILSAKEYTFIKNQLVNKL